MIISGEDAFVADLQSVVGDDLRSIATCDEDGYEFLYLRDGLRERAEDIAEDIHQNLVLEGIGKVYLEDLFEAGDLHCTLHEFEELQAYHLVTGQFEGVFVGIDTDSDTESAAIRSVVRERAGE